MPLPPPAAADMDAAVRAYHIGDYAGALRLLEPLAAQDDPEAQYMVGFMYAQGLGVPRDYGAAARWYERAAMQGHAAAQNYLGLLYYEGRGRERDFRTAFIWFELAAAQGNEDGINNRLIVARRMNTAQITEAQMRAGELIARIQRHEGEQMPNAIASGVAVSAAGHVLTHRSVPENCQQLKVRRGETVTDARVALVDDFNDLVLLATAAPLADPATFRHGEPPQAGEPVSVIGYRIDPDLAIVRHRRDGEVSGLPTISRIDQRYVEILVDGIEPTDNGAPVFDDAGNLVAILAYSADPAAIARVTGPLPPSLTFGMRAGLVGLTMDINDIAYLTDAHAARANAAEAVAEDAAGPVAEGAAVAIECWRGQGVQLSPEARNGDAADPR